MADQDPELRLKFSKEGRLWLLSLECASAGAVTSWATDSIGQGVLAFLVSLAVLGPLLWLFENGGAEAGGGRARDSAIPSWAEVASSKT